MNNKLVKALELTLWMAIRYANGRHTYAPDNVREAVKLIKEVYPDFKIKEDKTLKKYDGHGLESDYLQDIFE